MCVCVIIIIIIVVDGLFEIAAISWKYTVFSSIYILQSILLFLFIISVLLDTFPPPPHVRASKSGTILSCYSLYSLQCQHMLFLVREPYYFCIFQFWSDHWSKTLMCAPNSITSSTSSSNFVSSSSSFSRFSVSFILFVSSLSLFILIGITFSFNPHIKTILLCCVWL